MINKVGFYIRQQFKTFMNNQYEDYDKMIYYSYNEIALLSYGILNNNDLCKKSLNFINKMREKGSKIFSVRHLRKMGINRILKEIPKNKRYYITIDIE